MKSLLYLFIWHVAVNLQLSQRTFYPKSGMKKSINHQTKKAEPKSKKLEHQRFRSKNHQKKEASIQEDYNDVNEKDFKEMQEEKMNEDHAKTETLSQDDMIDDTEPELNQYGEEMTEEQNLKEQELLENEEEEVQETEDKTNLLESDQPEDLPQEEPDQLDEEEQTEPEVETPIVQSEEEEEVEKQAPIQTLEEVGEELDDQKMEHDLADQATQNETQEELDENLEEDQQQDDGPYMMKMDDELFDVLHNEKDGVHQIETEDKVIDMNDESQNEQEEVQEEDLQNEDETSFEDELPKGYDQPFTTEEEELAEKSLEDIEKSVQSEDQYREVLALKLEKMNEILEEKKQALDTQLMENEQSENDIDYLNNKLKETEDRIEELKEMSTQPQFQLKQQNQEMRVGVPAHRLEYTTPNVHQQQHIRQTKNQYQLAKSNVEKTLQQPLQPQNLRMHRKKQDVVVKTKNKAIPMKKQLRN